MEKKITQGDESKVLLSYILKHSPDTNGKIRAKILAVPNAVIPMEGNQFSQ